LNFSVLQIALPFEMTDPKVDLFLTSELFYPDLPGGLMRFYRYGPGLKERGINPHVVTFRQSRELPEEEEVNGIRILRHTQPEEAPGKTLRPWLLKVALTRALAAKAAGKLAVLQPNAISRHLAPTLTRARLNGIGAVFNPGITPENRNSGRSLSRVRTKLVNLPVCCTLSKVVFLSHQLEREFRPFLPLRASQRNVIPNGVDLNRFRPPHSPDERDLLRQSLNIGNGHKVVLLVGGIMPRKGVDIVLRAWSQVQQAHPDAILLVVGSNARRASHESTALRADLDAYLDEIEQLTAQSPNPRNVRFVGEVDDPAPYYRAADLFAFPSHREGLPNAVLEAMASALPCLVARFDGIPPDGGEMGSAGTHYVAIGHDPEEWAARIVEMLHTDHVEELRQLRQAARKLIEDRHDLSAILDRWHQVYRQSALE